MNIFIMLLMLIFSLTLRAEITTDGSLGTALTLPGPDYQIKAELGQRLGNNLFHSFGQFNLSEHESATFSGPPEIDQVISRVTGGHPSKIEGTLRSTFPQANIYFLNPYGLLFGTHARLEVNGSFHASTADTLRFQDGGEFNARMPNQSLLSLAPVASFGFLSATAASATVEQSSLVVPAGKTFSLTAGSINLSQATIQAESGQIYLAAVATPDEVTLQTDRLSSTQRQGPLSITAGSTLQVNGEGAGSVFIHSGQFVVSDSGIQAQTLGTESAGVIDIQSDTVSFTEGAFIDGSTYSSGKGADIKIQASDSVTFSGTNRAGVQSSILSRSGSETDMNKAEVSDGNAGKVTIDAKNIYFKDGARISASTISRGKGGNVELIAQEEVVFKGKDSQKRSSYLASSAAYRGKQGGDAGNVMIQAKNVIFDDDTYINSRTFGEGDGSHVSVQADNIYLKNGSRIIIDARATGNAGHATLNAKGDIHLTGINSSGRGSQILASANESGTGDGGNISITTNNLLLADGAYIIANTFGAGQGGNINITATRKVTLTGVEDRGWTSLISSSSNPKTSSSTPGGTDVIGGRAGNVNIKAEQLVIQDGAQIASNSIAPKGSRSSSGGEITIEVTGETLISGVNIHGENEDGFGAGIYARSIGIEDNAGPAGKITLHTGSLVILSGGVIKSSTNNNAQGGNIEIQVKGSAKISGDSSDILLQMPKDSQNRFLVGFVPKTYNQSTSGIYANSESRSDHAGKGGDILFHAENVTLTNKGKISTSSSGGGAAGQIILSTERTQLDQSAITTEANSAGGGEIIINNSELFHIHHGQITTSVKEGAGNGGNITLSIPRFVVLNHAQIKAKAQAGRGGNIRLSAEQFLKTPDSLITASSERGIDGEIFINAPDEDISNCLATLPSTFSDLSNHFYTPCKRHQEGETNHFTINRFDGSRSVPSDWHGSH